MSALPQQAAIAGASLDVSKVPEPDIITGSGGTPAMLLSTTLGPRTVSYALKGEAAGSGSPVRAYTLRWISRSRSRVTLPPHRRATVLTA
jgi:hypothetical protein